MKRLMAIAVAAFALLGADGRDTAIYNGRLTSAMNANGMAITNAPTPVRDGDLVNKAYVDGISGVTPGTVTNIAESAAVTNAGAVASAKAYADGTFLPLTGGTMTDEVEFPYSKGLIFNNYNRIYSWASEMISFENTKNGYSVSDLTPDNTDVLTVNKVKTDFPVITNSYMKGQVDTALAQKADRAVPATANNFAALTSSGNLADSNYSPSSFRSSTWVPSWSQVTSKPSWIGSSKPTYTYDEVGAAPAVDGGYLPISAGPSYSLTDSLYAPTIHLCGDGYKALYLDDNETYEVSGTSGSIFFRCNSYFSLLVPDGTPVMTLGQADFHIVTTSPVTSGQIGNFNITNLTAKTVSCSVSETSGKSSDILIWTYGNTAECQMTFTLPSGFTLVGDAADTKATANKKCLFSLVKISNTEVIVSKKEYN